MCEELRVKQYRKRNESEDFKSKAATLKGHRLWGIEGDDQQPVSNCSVNHRRRRSGAEWMSD